MGLAMARKFRPAAVALDIGLPDTTGWSVLDQFQHDPDLRHVPIHMLSIYEDRRRGMELGAASYSRKAEGREVIDEVLARVADSIFRRSREVLVVNADAQCRDAIADVLGIEGMNVTSPQSAAEAIEAYRASRFDCVILCAGASEISPQDLLSELQKAAAGEDLRILIFSMDEEAVQNLNFTPIREGAVIRKVQNSRPAAGGAYPHPSYSRKRAAGVPPSQAGEASPVG